MSDLLIARKGVHQMYIGSENAQAFADAGFELFRTELVPINTQDELNRIVAPMSRSSSEEGEQRVEIKAPDNVIYAPPVIERRVEDESN